MAEGIAFSWKAFLSEFSVAARGQFSSLRELVATEAGPLVAWEREGSGPCIYISAGIHGDEPAGPLALLELLRAGCFPKEAELVLCPALNPTGLSAGTRANAQGIDLNRDYLQRQTAEVRAHSDWLSRRRLPDLFLSLHEDSDAKGFYLYEINCGADNPGTAAGIINAVAPIFAPEPGPIIDDHTARAPGWIYHPPIPDVPDGWPEAIFLARLGCPLSFTFETPMRADLSKRVAALRAAVQAALESLCR